MSKKKVQYFKVLRSFGRDGKWRHKQGAEITKNDIPGEPIDRLIMRGVIEPLEVEDDVENAQD